MKLTKASLMMTPAIERVVATMIGLTAFGQDVPEDDPHVAHSHGPRGIDEDLGPERQEEAPHQPGQIPGQPRDGEDEHDHPPVAVAETLAHTR